MQRLYNNIWSKYRGREPLAPETYNSIFVKYLFSEANSPTYLIFCYICWPVWTLLHDRWIVSWIRGFVICHVLNIIQVKFKLIDSLRTNQLFVCWISDLSDSKNSTMYMYLIRFELFYVKNIFFELSGFILLINPGKAVQKKSKSQLYVERHDQRSNNRFSFVIFWVAIRFRNLTVARNRIGGAVYSWGLTRK